MINEDASLTPAKPRLDFVDGLRGLAILLVVLRHFYVLTYFDGYPRWADALGLGYVGVPLFLLLSGFCVFWAYVGPNRRAFDARDFFRRRIARIFPPYLLALGIALIVSPPTGRANWFLQIATHLTMTHNLLPGTVLALNGAFWSLALEFQLYLLFPLLLRVTRRYGIYPMLAGVFVAQMAFRVWAMRYGTTYGTLSFVLPWSVPGRMFEFALGMWAATVVSSPQPRALLPRLRLLGVPAALAAFAVAVASKGRFGVTHPLTDLFWTVGFTLLILSAARPNAENDGPGLGRLLRWRPLVALGTASYSVYLVHEFVLETLIDAFHARIDLHPGGLFLLPIFVAVTLAVCAVYFRAVEKPLIDFFGRRRARETRVVVAGSQSP